MSEVGVNGMHSIGEQKWKPAGQTQRAEGYREGYLRALEDVRRGVIEIRVVGTPSIWAVLTVIDGLKQSYQKEQNDGKD